MWFSSAVLGNRRTSSSTSRTSSGTSGLSVAPEASRKCNQQSMPSVYNSPSPCHRWTAVSRGAVMHGLMEQQEGGAPRVGISSRIARASFGTTCNILPWEEGVHHQRDRAWCPIQQEYLAIDQTRWFLITVSAAIFHLLRSAELTLPQGETLRVGEPIVHMFWYDIEGPEEEITAELVYSSARRSPSRCDETVKKLCVVKWRDIPPYDSLPTWINAAGQELRQVRYEIRIVCSGASIDFAIYYEDQRVASQNVSVDFEDSGTAAASRFRDDDDD